MQSIQLLKDIKTKIAFGTLLSLAKGDIPIRRTQQHNTEQHDNSIRPHRMLQAQVQPSPFHNESRPLGGWKRSAWYRGKLQNGGIYTAPRSAGIWEHETRQEPCFMGKRFHSSVIALLREIMLQAMIPFTQNGKYRPLPGMRNLLPHCCISSRSNDSTLDPLRPIR